MQQAREANEGGKDGHDDYDRRPRNQGPLRRPWVSPRLGTAPRLAPLCDALSRGGSRTRSRDRARPVGTRVGGRERDAPGSSGTGEMKLTKEGGEGGNGNGG